jgi:molybdenum cofactor biosynthesis protein B
MKHHFLSSLCLLSLIQACDAKEYTLQDQSKGVLERRMETLQLRGKVGIIVASDSGRAESGELAASLLKKAGFKTTEVRVVKNLDIKEALQSMLDTKDIDAVVCIGGTGISPHDTTVEAVNDVSEKSLPGYGELLRAMTDDRWKKYKKDIGLLSIDTRANAGVAKNKVIFAVPGSPDGTQLALSEIIIPGLPTLLGQLQKKEEEPENKNQ